MWRRRSRRCSWRGSGSCEARKARAKVCKRGGKRWLPTLSSPFRIFTRGRSPVRIRQSPQKTPDFLRNQEFFASADTALGRARWSWWNADVPAAPSLVLYFNTATKETDHFCSFSAKSSICRTNSLGLIFRAAAILQMVVKFACFVPFSIIVKCVRAIPANPLKTSCDNPFDLRMLLMVFPITLSSNNSRLTSL